jgi:hypothetical protein
MRIRYSLASTCTRAATKSGYRPRIPVGREEKSSAIRIAKYDWPCEGLPEMGVVLCALKCRELEAAKFHVEQRRACTRTYMREEISISFVASAT